MANSVIKNPSGLPCDLNRELKCFILNFGKKFNFKVNADGNGVGLIVFNQHGGHQGLWTFAHRIPDNIFAIEKIGGSSTATLTATIQSTGEVEITSSNDGTVMILYTKTPKQ